MVENLLLVARQVGILFILMSIGYLCNKRKMVNDSTIKGIVEILVVIVTPCLIINAFKRPFESHLLSGLGWALGGALLAHILGILAAHLIHTKEKASESVLRFGVIFSNAGFMGIPLEYAILGNDGVFFGAVYVALFNFLCWSYGLIVMCGSLKDLKIHSLLINPGTVGIAIGLPFFLFSWNLPPVFDVPMKMIADLNTPLAMIVVGYYLAQSKFKTVLTSIHAYLAAFLRLIVIPLLVLLAFIVVKPNNGAMVVAIVIASSAPVAALTSMLATRYERDVSLSVGLVAGTTLLSILTMPLIVGLAMSIFR
jgi:predicted permease